jgi:hypothetical protein
MPAKKKVAPKKRASAKITKKSSKKIAKKISEKKSIRKSQDKTEKKTAKVYSKKKDEAKAIVKTQAEVLEGKVFDNAPTMHIVSEREQTDLVLLSLCL